METTRSRTSTKALAILAIILFFLVLTINGLANALPLNGVGTGQLSDEIPNLFVPAGLTFSIWGLIYILLAGYVGFVAFEVFGKRGGAAWETTDGLLFAINASANTAWIFAWHWRLLPLSLGLMLLILGSLIALESRTEARLRPGEALADGSRARRFFLSIPLRVYLGWICVATIANVTALLVKSGWMGFGLDPRLWTVLVIGAGLAIALGFVFKKGGIAAPLVVVWAYAGIVIKRTSLDPDYSRPVWIAAALAALIILGAIGFRSLRKRGD